MHTNRSISFFKKIKKKLGFFKVVFLGKPHLRIKISVINKYIVFFQWLQTHFPLPLLPIFPSIAIPHNSAVLLKSQTYRSVDFCQNTCWSISTFFKVAKLLHGSPIIIWLFPCRHAPVAYLMVLRQQTEPTNHTTTPLEPSKSFIFGLGVFYRNLQSPLSPSSNQTAFAFC